mmetsp:Transcript_31356/g.48085  ORF Transcript_31356/g.48085 Transcript_31356/m.48085 type:complete len:268 (+) Transcript_31356:1794-2597(+)
MLPKLFWRKHKPQHLRKRKKKTIMMTLPCLRPAQVVQVAVVLYRRQAIQAVHHLPTVPRLLKILGEADVREDGVRVVVEGVDHIHLRVLHLRGAGHRTVVGPAQDRDRLLGHHQDGNTKGGPDRILATAKVAVVRIVKLEIKVVGDAETALHLPGHTLGIVERIIGNLHRRLARSRTKRPKKHLRRKTTKFERIGIVRNPPNQILVVKEMETVGLLGLDTVHPVIKGNLPRLMTVIIGVVPSLLGRIRVVIEMTVIDDLHHVRIGKI